MKNFKELKCFHKRSRQKVLLICIGMLFCFKLAWAQDLEPGFMSAMPIGGNIGIISYGHSRGDILLDNTLPVDDLNSKLNSIGLGYFRSFKLFNRLAKFDVVLPYAFGEFNGSVEGVERTVYKNGFGDPLLRLSMIFVGTDPLKTKDFFKSEQKKFKLGGSLRLKVPLGQYEPDKLVNLGGNRWGLKTAVAGSYTFKNKLILEAHMSAWFFGVNDDFFGGNTSKQKPLYGVQLHGIYIFKPGVWVAASIGGVRGGKVEINGIEKESQVNNRFGLSFAYRLNNNNSLKAAYTNGIFTASGADINTLLIAYQFLWFDKK